MGKQSAPPAPDYTAAANATAAGNLAAAQQATVANRVNQVGPNGSLTYTQADPSNPNSQWTATQTLSPAQQELQNTQNSLSKQYGNIAQTGLAGATGALSSPTIDQTQLAAMPQNAGTTTQDAMMARLAPQQAIQTKALDTQLANQGIQQGSEAWQNAKTQQSQQQNDQRNQAALQGIQVDMQARNQGIANQSAIINQPLNVINALRTGSQVTGQNYVNPAMQSTTAGADLLGAANAQYGQQMNAYNANQSANAGMMGGLMGMAGTAMGGPMGGMMGKAMGMGG